MLEVESEARIDASRSRRTGDAKSLACTRCCSLPRASANDHYNYPTTLSSNDDGPWKIDQGFVDFRSRGDGVWGVAT